MLRTTLSELRLAARALRKQPRFTIVAATTLALGIAAVTSIFSVVNGVLLKPLPYPDAERLVNVESTAPGLGYDSFPQSPDLYDYFRQHNDVFEDTGIYQTRRANLTELETPQVIDIAIASPSYFSTLGVTFAEGRPFTIDEDRAGATPVAVVSDRFWTRQLGRQAGFVGRSIRLDGVSRQVVGIAPAWLDEPDSPDVWIPTGWDPAQLPTGQFGWSAIARLKPGVTPAMAESRLEPLVQQALGPADGSPLYQAFIRDGRYRPVVRDMKEDVVGDVRQPLWILLATVGMVLLIACANVANLFLVRAEGLQREIAVRAALGGSRWSLVRQRLIEAGLLAAIGTALGVALSASTLPALLALAPSTIPRLDQVRLDSIVVLVAAGVSLVSALLFGLLPALRYTRPQILSALRQGGRTGTDDAARRRARQALVVAQTALALVLLVGSGLLARSFGRMMAADLGFDPRDVMTFRVTVPASSYAEPAEVTRFEQDLVERLRALPLVEGAGATTTLPVADGSPGSAFDFEGRPLQPGQLPPIVHYKTVTRGYFQAMRIPLLAGRDLDSSDAREDAYTVVVNRALADQYWPGEDPLGKRLRGAVSEGDPPPWLTVVGVVGTVRDEGLRRPARPLIYYPDNLRAGQRGMTYVVRGPNVAARADELRRAVWAMDDDLPIASMRTMDEVVERSVVQFSFTMLTLGIAAVMALVLGAIGLYGVLSYAVSLRTREIGVRLALGAPPARVRRSVVASGAAITGIGMVIGLAGAFGLTRFLSGLLYEVEPLDPATFAAMTAVLAIVALAASYLPARKASSVSPLESMRAE